MLRNLIKYLRLKHAHRKADDRKFRKAFYKIKDSAHSPLWENANDSMEVMKKIRERAENG